MKALQLLCTSVALYRSARHANCRIVGHVPKRLGPFCVFHVEKTASTLAARSNALICVRYPAEIVGSNPTGGMDVSLLRVLCVVG